MTGKNGFRVIVKAGFILAFLFVQSCTPSGPQPGNTSGNPTANPVVSQPAVRQVPSREEDFREKTGRHYRAIDLSDFRDGFSHARYAYENEIPPWALYEPDQILGICENMIYMQNPDGGWAKNRDFQRIYTLRELEKIREDNGTVAPVTWEVTRDERASTLDNRNTYSQVRYLYKAHEILKESRPEDAERCLFAAERALRWILAAQNPESGGWSGADVCAITYNDDVMVGTLALLRDVGRPDGEFTVFSEGLRGEAFTAYQKGIRCILDTQITVTLDDGTEILTAWGQQHSHSAPFRPVWARSFEPPAICSSESYKIVRLLMEDPSPDDEIRRAVRAAREFFDRDDVRIHGKRLEETDTEPVLLNGRNYTTDRHLVDDPSAGDLWARFYALDASCDVESGAPEEIRGRYPEILAPIWCDTGCIFRESYNDLSRERRCGYTYINGGGERLVLDAENW